MNRLFQIFSLFLAVNFYCQVSLSAVVEGHDYRVDQPFTLAFVMELHGDHLVQESSIKLPDFSKFEIIGTASETNESFAENSYVKQLVYQIVLRPKKAGTLKIGSALVKVNGQDYSSESFDIYVKKADRSISSVEASKKNRDDVYLNVELQDQEVYKNQPTIAVLKAYSKNYHNFRRVKNIQAPKQDNLYIKAISNAPSDVETSVNKMASQVMAIYMVFPKKNGQVDMQPISANLASDDRLLVSNKVKINVKELPANAPKDYKNAVGKFDVKITKYTNENVEVKKPINISVKLSGEGNLDQVELPKLKPSKDYSIYQPQIVEQTSIGKKGIKGDILANYVIIPKKTGNLKISTESFSFFDPSQKKYVEIGEKSVEVQAISHDEMIATKTPIQRVNEFTNTVLETVDNPVIETENLKVPEKDQFRWKPILINVGLLLAVVFAYLFLSKRRRQQNKRYRKITVGPVENVTDTEEKIRSHFATGFQDLFQHLAFLVGQGKDQEIFETIAEIDQHAKKQYSTSDSEFLSLLEKEEGSQMVEEYRALQQKIQMEKYAPVRNPEQMKTLTNQVIQFYSKIQKS